MNSTDSDSDISVDDNATREGVAEVACQLELGIARESNDGAMFALFENIGRLSHDQYCSPHFLAGRGNGSSWMG